MSPNPFADPRVRSIETADPAVAHEILHRVYKLQSLDAGAPGDSFRFRRSVTGEPRFAVGHLEYGGVLRTISDPIPYFSIATVVGGRVTVSDGVEEVRGESGSTIAFSSKRVKDTQWDHLELSQIMIDRDSVEKELASLGLTAPRGLHLTSMSMVSASHQKHWRSVTAHLRQLVQNDAAMSSPLVRTAAFRTLVTAFVEGFSTTAVPLDHRGEGRQLPSTVRRAMAFMDEHAHDDIGVVEIAEAARLTPRGLQLAFRKHLDTTPMAELRQARLRGAHGDLVAGDPTLGHTVAGIAASWGFAHAGRFSAIYLAAYGRSPRETLES